MIRLIFNISTIIEIWGLLFYLVFVYPGGKPIIPHLLCYQRLAVDDYGFALDAARSKTEIPLSGGYRASSAFAQLR